MTLRHVTFALCLLFATHPVAAESARIGVVSLPPGKGNPFRSSAAYSSLTWSAIFEPLTLFDQDRALTPMLAESWALESPTRWIFKIRPGIQFSNGESLNAAAVAATINYLASDAGASSAVSREVQSVVTAEVIDDLTVAINTESPDVFLPRYLNAVSIVAPGQWARLGPDGFAQNPVGTGPYKVDRWTSAEVSLSPNPNAWRPAQLEEIQIVELAELTTRLQGLLSERIDVAIQINPEDRISIERAGGSIVSRDALDVITITYVIGEGHPVDDLRVRKALNFAVNRQAIVDVLLDGRTVPASQPAVRGVVGYNDETPAFAYDPDKARALLAEAGYPDGFSLSAEVIIGSNINDGAIYQQVAANLAAVGVDLKIVTIPTTQMARVILQGDWQGDAFSQIFGAWPAFDPIRSIRMHSCDWPNPWYCNPDLMELYNAARSSKSIAERETLTSELVAAYRDLETALYLYEIPLFDGLGPRVASYAVWPGRIDYAALAIKKD